MSAADLGLFLAAALVLAVMPGPGMLYVGARALAGGFGEGLASTAGTGLGGLLHVVAGALGLSAVVMASAEAFALMKLLGGFYLMWLGVQAWRQARLSVQPGAELPALGMLRAFREGVVVEALNPKTAAFFLAFIPQFLDPAQGDMGWRFVLLGSICVAANTLADAVVALAAGRLRDVAGRRGGLLLRLRQAGAGLMMALGLGVLLLRRPAV
jgi:threonine/homoserine/homoserine lactone efflux protein